MTQDQFFQMSSVNIFNAIWYAKWAGVPAKIVRAWVDAFIASCKTH